MPWEIEFFPDAPWKRRRHAERLGLRVLAVVPERRLARLVEVNFRRLGFAVDVAGSAEDAIGVLADSIPNVLVLDADVPAAQAVLAYLRAQPEGDGTLVILVVTRDGRDEIRKGWGTGSEAILTKPFNPMKLAALVGRAWDLMLEERPGAELLRPAEAPDAASLLRPAAGVTESNPTALLRPVPQKQDEQP